MRKEINKAALAPAQLTADSASQTFCFAESFVGFAGHFPGYPILPAILQTLLAQILAEQLIGEPLQFVELKRAKFTRQLRPAEKINVNISCKEKEGQLLFSAQLGVEDESAASFTLVLGRGAAL